MYQAYQSKANPILIRAEAFDLRSRYARDADPAATLAGLWDRKLRRRDAPIRTSINTV